MWFLYAFVGAIVWGLDYTFGESVFRSKISPITLLALQMGCGTIIFSLLGCCSRFKTDIPILLNDHKALLFTIGAIITFCLGNALIFMSIQAKNATLATLIEIIYPLFTIGFTWMIFKVIHVNLATLCGGLLIFSGVVIINVFGLI